MKKGLVLLIVLFSITLVKADEGMYLPFKLKQYYKDMKAAGLEMSHKKIYNAKKPSVKDAIVSLGGFCTAEIISSKGLMLTNHHCGYDAIREHSTPENDYLTDGFWAKSISEEKPVPGLTASIVVKIIDVTGQMLAELNDNMDADERALRIRQFSKELSDIAVEGTSYKAYVKPFYEGNEFYLFITEVFEDVRLVGAPPSSIGKYGGDTDNWMWIRHTGDFSMFRIYSNKSNESAPFALDNVPYSPKHHLPISIKGIEDGDFTMVMGYPGSTDRYLTSYGVKMAIEKDQPSRVIARGEKLDIMKIDMKASDATRLKYASTYAQVSNYWKYFIGQTEQLKKNNVLNKKQIIENKYSKWVNETPEKKAKYGKVLSDIKEAYSVLEKFNPTVVYFYEAIYSISFNQFLIKHIRLYNELTKETVNQEQVKKMVDYYQKTSASHFENIDLETEKKLVSRLLEVFMSNVPKGQYSKELMFLYQKHKMNATEFVNIHLSNSIFSNKSKYDEFIKNPNIEALSGDKLFLLMRSLMNKYRDINGNEEMSKAHSKLDKANRLFVAGLREMNPDKKYYPNANSTLRLSYGNVGRYKKSDGILYDYYTTIEGLMAKENPDDDEFIVPSKLKSLFEKKDYGRYGQDGTLPVDFISNNDITGGNSGSPVMNSKGELIGCAFDGNWEAMSGDIAFEEKLQRTISVDIRYVLFIIEKYAEASNLIDEMTIIED